MRLAKRTLSTVLLFATAYLAIWCWWMETRSIRSPARWYAVYSASTPNGESHRSYDYAFYLPLTAMAWEKIGFGSLVILVGSRCEWANDPALRLILNKLEVDRKALVVFLEAPLENRMMLSQLGRIFAANLMAGRLNDHDYLITADADLWPLRRDHFVPRPGHDLVLLHSDCCGTFTVPWRGSRTFPMYPMSNIGASVSTWREVMNGHGRILAKNSESIFKYFEDEGFPTQILRDRGQFNGGGWLWDQQMISIRLADWMDRNGNGSPPVYRVSDHGYSRVDRISWDGDQITSTDLETIYDAHLLLKPFLPDKWLWIRPLLALMHGGNESESLKWCQVYYEEFNQRVQYYMHWLEPDYDKQV